VDVDMNDMELME